MNTTKTIPTKESIKEQYLINKYMKAKKNQINAEIVLFSVIVFAGIVSTLIF